MSHDPGNASRVFGNYTQTQLDAQYDQRSLVPDISEYMQRWKLDSTRSRNSPAYAGEFSYADTPSATLDLFKASNARGLVVYLHGGAWRMLSKAESSYPAPALMHAGWSMAAIDFELVPAVSLREQLEQCRQAIVWLARNAELVGAKRLMLLGHSSGAHLAGLLATTDWVRDHALAEDPVCGAVLVSGIYDLEPVRLSARNDFLRLTEADVPELSPIRHIRAGACPVVVAWGAKELDEFKRQSQVFADSWKTHGNVCMTVCEPDLNHFDMSFQFADSGTQLFTAMQDLLLD